MIVSAIWLVFSWTVTIYNDTPGPQPPVDDLSGLELDQQLVVHAYNSAVSVVFRMVTGELKGLETAFSEFSKPPSAQPQRVQDKPPVEAGREEKTAKGKKGKVRGWEIILLKSV